MIAKWFFDTKRTYAASLIKIAKLNRKSWSKNRDIYIQVYINDQDGESI